MITLLSLNIMSGHNKWSKIKNKKGAKDAKKSAVFSKILVAVSAAAKTDPNPDTNSKLRAIIEKAKQANVPADTINRALTRSQEKQLDEFVMEAYGPGGIAIIIETITDNTNRTSNELKRLVADNGGKIAEPGSVLWAFEKSTSHEWISKFPQEISLDFKERLEKLTSAIQDHPDVQEVTHNAK